MMDHLPRERIKGAVREERLVGFFPGSRVREVRKLFPVMLSAARRVRRIMPDVRFEVSAANEQLEREIRKILKGDTMCEVSVGRARELMQRASLGIIASGTATLEAAYFGLPMSIVYKVSPLTYLVAKWVIKIRRIGIVNILANRDIVKEYVQHRASESNIMYEIFRLIGDDGVRLKMVDNLKDVVRKLGRRGASERAAGLIASTVTS
jgi:lipid-A-disaccharide synthase